MKKSQPSTLICTLGTSLFRPNLFGLLVPKQYSSWLGCQPEGDLPVLNSDLGVYLKGR
jgi:hypothetical protein